MIQVSGISLPFTEDPRAAVLKARKAARLGRAQEGQIIRRSVDARRRGDIRFVYTVGFTPEGDEERFVQNAARRDVSVRRPARLDIPKGAAPLENRPVVAGFGPAGMFCALLLAQGGLRPIVLERGGDIDARVRAVDAFCAGGPLLPDCNIQFGEGGAGAFSDGKLVTRIGDQRGEWVLGALARFGAPEEILWQARPHIGTDRLRGVVRALRAEIVRLGGEVRFNTALTGLTLRAGTVRGVMTGSGALPAGVVVAALGHSARDSLRMLLAAGAHMTGKPFSVGVRVEHLRAQVDAALYGDAAGHPLLPPAEYQLSHRAGDRGVYTFCMCPGGVVVPAASSPGMLAVNGMSEFKRDGVNSNSALVCGVDPSDFGSGPLDGVLYQEELEKSAFLQGGGDFRAPCQTAGRFLEGLPGAAFSQVSPSCARGVREGDFTKLFAPRVQDMLRMGLRRFGSRQRGFDDPGAVLTGVETRTSSPVRVARGAAFESNLPGLFPCGEGAGYAGGIISAAVDGVRVAQEILGRYRAPL